MSAVRNYFCQLNRSFAALHAALENRRVVRWVLVALLSIHTVLLGYSAYVHSPTLNEPGHLVAGLSYWKFGRFDVYSVNPPLVKLVAALPVIAVGYEEDWSGFHIGAGARPEFAMGEDFVAANGRRSFFLFMLARWACIPFSWIGAIVCYLWGRDLYGRQAGLLACFLWCFEPNILAHASLITSDAGGSALGIAACYTFWRWLKKPTWPQAALTGIVLGLAELAKTTLILFYPLWPLLWLIYRWSDRATLTARDWLREAGMLALRMSIGIYVVNFGYGFEGSLTPLRDFAFVSDMLTEDAVGLPQATNRFAHSWLRQIPVPFPKNYLLGIDIQQHDFEDYNRPSYLGGVWRDHGWWYYYLYAGLIKVPLGIISLGVLTIGMWLMQRFRQDSIARCRDEMVLLFPAIVIFCVVSSKTGFSEHFRYVLPVFPFVFVFLGRLARILLTANYREPYPTCVSSSRRCKLMLLGAPSLTLLLGCWLIDSSMWVYPHSLSYFNESIGGPRSGGRYLLGSNLDWGQDIRYLPLLTESLVKHPVVLIYPLEYSACNPAHLLPDWFVCRMGKSSDGVAEGSPEVRNVSWLVSGEYSKLSRIANNVSELNAEGMSYFGYTWRLVYSR